MQREWCVGEAAELWPQVWVVGRAFLAGPSTTEAGGEGQGQPCRGPHGRCSSPALSPVTPQQEPHVGGWAVPFQGCGWRRWQTCQGCRQEWGKCGDGAPNPEQTSSELELSRLRTPNPSCRWLCGPLLLTHSRWGHHVSKPGSWGTRTPGNRQMAGWGLCRQGWHRGASQRGWGRGLAGLSLSRFALCLSGPPAPSGVPEVPGEPCRFWGLAWAAGQRGHGSGSSLGHTVSDPCSIPACPVSGALRHAPGPSSPRLSLTPWGLGLGQNTPCSLRACWPRAQCFAGSEASVCAEPT